MLEVHLDGIDANNQRQRDILVGVPICEQAQHLQLAFAEHEFGHSTRLVLVDKNGTIRDTFEGLPDDEFPDGKERFEAGLTRLKGRVRELLPK